MSIGLAVILMIVCMGVGIWTGLYLAVWVFVKSEMRIENGILYVEGKPLVNLVTGKKINAPDPRP